MRSFSKFIPQTTIYRLSLYLRELERLNSKGLTHISSKVLSKKMGVTDAQVRRDLSYFGKFGKSRVGYNIEKLAKKIRQILGIDNKTWKVALIGAGNLGRALFSYKGFRERGFLIKAVFDSDPLKIGKDLGGIRVKDVKDLVPTLKKGKFDIAIIAVPQESAQEVAKALVKARIRAILNFAPLRLDIPQKTILRNVDLSMELESLSFYLSKLR